MAMPKIVVQGATRPTGALSPLLPVACSKSALLAKGSVVLEGVAQVSLKVHRWVERGSPPCYLLSDRWPVSSNVVLLA
jgi:hypothetical protein